MKDLTFNLPSIYTYDMPQAKDVDFEIEQIEIHLHKLKKMKVLAQISEMIIKNEIDARFKIHKIHEAIGNIKQHPNDFHLECEFSYPNNSETQMIVNELEKYIKAYILSLFFYQLDFKKVYIINHATLTQFCENFFPPNEALIISQGYIKTEKNFLENNIYNTEEVKKIKL